MKTIEIKEGLEDLKHRLKSAKTHQSVIRIQCIVFLKEKRFKNRTSIADTLGVSLSSIDRWIKIYQSQGIEQLLKMTSGGKRREVITKEIHEKLSEKLQDAYNPLLGFHDAVKWVEDNFNLQVKYTTLYSYIRKNFGGKLKVPRKSHYKNNTQAVEDFKKNTKIV